MLTRPAQITGFLSLGINSLQLIRRSPFLPEPMESTTSAPLLVAMRIPSVLSTDSFFNVTSTFRLIFLAQRPPAPMASISSATHGFSLSHGHYQQADVPNAANTFLGSLNDLGRCVGCSYSDPVNGPFLGFIQTGKPTRAFCSPVQ
jgi:hypothetical protein